MTLRLLLPPSVGAARARARAELLDQSLRADLGEPVEVEVAADYAELAARAASRDVHLAWLPPTICARVEPALRALYKCVRHGRGTYRSALLVRRGTFSTPLELRGRQVAWVDRLSVGGHLLAAAQLVAAGLTLPGDLGEQRFLGSYPDALRELLEGRVDAAAILVRDDSPAALRESLAAHGGRAAVESVVALFVSPESPNDAIGLTRALAPRTADRLASRVFDREGARARAALCLAVEAEGFVRAKPDEYAPLRALLEGE